MADRATETLQYVHVDGRSNGKAIVIYSLSTCAFCKRAIDFVAAAGLGFRYVHLDEVDVEVKRAVKRELAERFDNIAVFPILVVDDAKAFSGFTKSVWAKALDINGR